MWADLSKEWKVAFEEAWTAYYHGCVPIGAAVFDAEGELILADHNRGSEKGILNRSIAHAEANAVRRLESDAEYNIRTATLYTTMEPCPMCMGTCVMGNIKHLRFAAKAPYCGATHLLKTDAYIARKNLDYRYIGNEMEFIQIVLQSVFEITMIEKGAKDIVLNSFRDMLPHAVMTAEKLYQEHLLNQWVDEARTMDFVFDEILSRAE